MNYLNIFGVQGVLKFRISLRQNKKINTQIYLYSVSIMNNSRIAKIQSSIEPYRQQILNHPLYAEITSLEELHLFMEHHVYAVWDFMSLLKSLQNQLTCTSVPWFPRKNSNTAYLINEIVVGEESDVDEEGVRKSHFELYLNAMHQAGANSAAMLNFTENLQKTGNLELAFNNCGTSDAVKGFVNFTFEVIHSQKAHNQAAIFTFGREDLIPGMFIALIEDFYSKMPNNLSKFKYYLDRHIEVDGGHHSHLALEMVNDLCGEKEEFWEEAEAVSISSLKKRIQLWDAVLEEILKNRKNLKNLSEVGQY
jgi:hypothetical protein